MKAVFLKAMRFRLVGVAFLLAVSILLYSQSRCSVSKPLPRPQSLPLEAIASPTKARSADQREDSQLLAYYREQIKGAILGPYYLDQQEGKTRFYMAESLTKRLDITSKERDSILRQMETMYANELKLMRKRLQVLPDPTGRKSIFYLPPENPKHAAEVMQEFLALYQNALGLERGRALFEHQKAVMSFVKDEKSSARGISAWAWLGRYGIKFWVDNVTIIPAQNRISQYGFTVTDENTGEVVSEAPGIVNSEMPFPFAALVSVQDAPQGDK